MTNTAWVHDRLTTLFPHATIQVIDTRGDDQHLSLIIRDQVFQGKTLVQRHQLVYTSLDNLRGGHIHALSIDAQP